MYTNTIASAYYVLLTEYVLNGKYYRHW